MKTNDTVTPEEFATFLRWLDPNPEEAGEKYNYIRKKLVERFLYWGCKPVEDLADEVINRVVLTIKDNPVTSDSGSPIDAEGRLPYFYTFANYVRLEHFRDLKKAPKLPQTYEYDSIERESRYHCLEQCLKQLPIDQRDLIIRYYSYADNSRVRHHQELAGIFETTINSLRIRTHRIRGILRKCIEECVGIETMFEM